MTSVKSLVRVNCSLQVYTSGRVCVPLFLSRDISSCAMVPLLLSLRFGSVPEETSDGSVAVAPVAKAAPAHLGCATQRVSIFARAPVCNHTCSYCLAQPCDVDMEHDDHTCYGCEQRKLNPAGGPNTPWRAPKLPACDQLCNQCSRKKCCLRYLHDIHACYWCNLHPGCVPTPLKVGTRIPLDVLVKKLRIDERKMRE